MEQIFLGRLRYPIVFSILLSNPIARVIWHKSLLTLVLGASSVEDLEITNNTAEDYGSVPLSRSTTARETSTIPKQQITRSHEQFTWFGKDAYVHARGGGKLHYESKDYYR